MPDEQTADLGCSSGYADNCSRIRLGHAFRATSSGDDLSVLTRVLHIVSGEAFLEPREPTEPGVVGLAEQVLGLRERPIYTFSGCLHPKLGTIGLIITPGCLERCLQGVSRCDSGGLMGRHGPFRYIEMSEVEDVLLSLTSNGDHGWVEAFSDEVNRSYDTPQRYISGDVPRINTWRDERAKCLLRHAEQGEVPDRRLWTWEVRLARAPDAADYKGLVLSHEAYKRVEQLRTSGIDIPDSVRVVRGNVGPDGVHYFNEAAVVDLLSGIQST